MFTKRAIPRHSKFYAMGKEAQKLAITLRSEGHSYESIADTLNTKYGDKLGDNKLSIMNTYVFFKKHGQIATSVIKEKQLENLSKEFDNTNSLKKLLNYLDETISYYKALGERLKLKDAVNAKLRIHELLQKEQSELEKDKQSDELKSFLSQVQNEFNTPSVTAEVEYDEFGNIRKKKMTKKVRINDAEGKIRWVDEAELIKENEEETIEPIAADATESTDSNSGHEGTEGI